MGRFLKNQKALVEGLRFAFISDPAGIRTQGPYIKSVLLYQLSYGIGPIDDFRLNRGAKIVFLVSYRQGNKKFFLNTT